jgi:predicted nucleic-acid-binding protein
VRAVDTNVVLRPILNDNAAQVAIARAVLSQPCLLLVSVILEAVWVLEARSDLTRDEIVGALFAILALPDMTCHFRDEVRWSLDRYAAGADFADMLHLALSGEATAFATFDRRIARHADPSVLPVETLA